MNAAQWIAIAIAVAIAVLIVAVAHWLLTHQLSKVWTMAGPLVRRCRYSAYAAAVVIGVNIALPSREEMEFALFAPIQHGTRIAMIGAITWLALSIAYAVTDTVLHRLAGSNGDADRRARRLQTQVRLMRRVVASVIGFLAFTAILFTFDAVRGLGAGLLASAGLLSVVAGVAAQSVLGNLFAGLQLAFSDTLRINDIVVYQGEWGRVEQLTLTNVTLRIWDERRLVVPVSDFTTNAFENWTKESTAITGWVIFRLDWGVPIDELREEVGSYVTQHPLWDGRRWSVQVTDVLDGGIVEVRAVVTTADSDARWDLCCDVREHVITYLMANYPESLPRSRTEFVTSEDAAAYAAVFPDSAFRRSRPASTTGTTPGTSGAGPDGSMKSGQGADGRETDGSSADGEG